MSLLYLNWVLEPLTQKYQKNWWFDYKVLFAFNKKPSAFLKFNMTDSWEYQLRTVSSSAHTQAVSSNYRASNSRRWIENMQTVASTIIASFNSATIYVLINTAPSWKGSKGSIMKSWQHPNSGVDNNCFLIAYWYIYL